MKVPKTGNIVIDFPENTPTETEPTEKDAEQRLIDQAQTAGQKPSQKENLMEYVGLWIKGIGGNSPVMLVLPEFKETLQAIGEQNYKGAYIVASIQVPERKLITRKNINAIKQYGVNILTKLMEKGANKAPSSVKKDIKQKKSD
jgi:hypothetical protein